MSDFEISSAIPCELSLARLHYGWCELCHRNHLIRRLNRGWRRCCVQEVVYWTGYYHVPPPEVDAKSAWVDDMEAAVELYRKWGNAALPCW